MSISNQWLGSMPMDPPHWSAWPGNLHLDFAPLMAEGKIDSLNPRTLTEGDIPPLVHLLTTRPCRRGRNRGKPMDSASQVKDLFVLNPF